MSRTPTVLGPLEGARALSVLAPLVAGGPLAAAFVRVKAADAAVGRLGTDQVLDPERAEPGPAVPLGRVAVLPTLVGHVEAESYIRGILSRVRIPPSPCRPGSTRFALASQFAALARLSCIIPTAHPARLSQIGGVAAASPVSKLARRSGCAT